MITPGKSAMNSLTIFWSLKPMDKQNPKVDYLEGTHFHRAKKASIRYGNVPKPYYGRYFRSAHSNRLKIRKNVTTR